MNISKKCVNQFVWSNTRSISFFSNDPVFNHDNFKKWRKIIFKPNKI